VPPRSPHDQQPPASRPAEVLSPVLRKARDASINRALAWLASRQAGDGSFPTLDIGQPAVTSLCVLAFLSCGHLPGEGPYGGHLEAALRFILSCQDSDGLIAKTPTPPGFQLHTASHTNIYNHAISGLALCEAYGMTSGARAGRIREAIEKAIKFTRGRQLAPKQYPEDRGGWRYLKRWLWRDSDMSVTSWQLVFLRSARNAGFDVPTEYVDQGLDFVRRCYDPSRGCFIYELSQDGNYPTRGMVGAGILSLSMAGLHQTEMAQTAAKWVLKNGFERYNQLPIDPRTGSSSTSRDRYHYSAYYCSQAFFQLGGRYWEQFYPPLAKTLVSNQSADGSWEAEAGEDQRYGNVYTTALIVLALSPPYQLLPVFQR
jgi:hypothetical protein